MDCKGKSSWPELVGVDGKKAVAIIERQNPLVEAFNVEEGLGVHLDFRCERVWVWTDKECGKVIEIPKIG
ncbi:hypothetical protein Taro_045491 [Colocasia esculenta]|uniref:Proteinase inhibitor n=1 Tax=Colocasia esculenta TaxID=4460 RepID=A0A843X6K9_COLES|nr:hypothetical protein [Colocasia esculenta]